VKPPLSYRTLGVLAALLLCAGTPAAAADYFAVVIRRAQPADYVLLEKVKINGKDELYRLAREGRLAERDYKALPRLLFSDVRRIQVRADAFQVQLQNKAEFLALPQNVKNWAGAAQETAAVVSDAVIAGRTAGGKGSASLALRPGWVIYLSLTRPGEDAIAFALAETEDSEDGWKRFLERYGGTTHAPEARARLGSSYLGRAQAALAQFRQALQNRTRGYAQLGEARRWLDQVRAVGHQGAEVTAVENALAQQESGIAQRLQQARALAENAQFDDAQEMLRPLAHFREEFPQLARELEAIQELRARHHITEARRRISVAEFDEAAAELDTAAKFRNLPEIEDVRREAAAARLAHARKLEIDAAMKQAEEAAARGDLGGALELIWPVGMKYADEPRLREAFAALRSSYGAELLTRVPQVESLHTPIRGVADEDVLLRLHGHLARLTQLEALPQHNVWRDRLSQHLADYYLKRAAELNQRAGDALAALSFGFLHQARYFALDKSEIAEYSARRAQVEEKLRLGVALNFRDLTPEAGGQFLLTELSTATGEAIQKGGFPRLAIFEATRLAPSAAADAGGRTPRASLEFHVELVGVGVRESAEDDPAKSEYSAGMRQVPNPEWRTAKENYDTAVARYEEIRMRIDRRLRQGRYDKREREADEQALSQAAAVQQAAKKAMDAISAFVEQEDVRPYEFMRRKVTRTAEIRLAYRWVNVQTGVREAGDLLTDTEAAQGVEVTGVHPADKHNHRNQPHGLPEAAALRGRVLRKIQAQLTSRALTHLQAFIDRDFERAGQEAERGNPETAAEYYLRFLFNSRPDDDRRAAALEFLRREFRLVALGEWLGSAAQPQP
jgi:hypothetical protein